MVNDNVVIFEINTTMRRTGFSASLNNEDVFRLCSIDNYQALTSY